MPVYYIMRQLLIPNATATLLQNASGFYYKMQILLQNATVTTNCNSFITKCDSYYKMRRLLQIATVQTNIKEIPYNSNSLQIRGIYCSKSREAKERNSANQKQKTTLKKLML